MDFIGAHKPAVALKAPLSGTIGFVVHGSVGMHAGVGQIPRQAKGQSSHRDLGRAPYMFCMG